MMSASDVARVVHGEGGRGRAILGVLETNSQPLLPYFQARLMSCGGFRIPHVASHVVHFIFYHMILSRISHPYPLSTYLEPLQILI